MKVTKKQFIAAMVIAVGITFYWVIWPAPAAIKEVPKTPSVTQEAPAAQLPDNELVSLTNNYRKANGLNELTQDANLIKSAEAKAKDLCDNQYWSHDRPDGTPFYSVIQKYNSDATYVGENLAKGYNDNASLFKAWQDSPTHKENLLKSRWNKIGIYSYYCGVNNITYVVQHFKED